MKVTSLGATYIESSPESEVLGELSGMPHHKGHTTNIMLDQLCFL